ncbi:peptide ABC transporter ATPase, partial [Streptomyces sp. RSD-27]
PYTRGLLDSLPRLDSPDDVPLPSIPGSPPSLLHPAPGCAFAPRCAVAAAPPAGDAGRCTGERPELRPYGSADRLAACHFAGALPAAAAPEVSR